MNIQDILSAFNANHEFIDSVINPQVNDGNRAAFAASLQRMVSTSFHDNEPNCNENQAVERRIGRTFADSNVHVLSTGGDAPQGTIVLSTNWSCRFWNMRSLRSDNAPKRGCSSPDLGMQGVPGASR